MAGLMAKCSPSQVDIEALGQALQVVEQKNLEYMNRIHKQEPAFRYPLVITDIKT